MLPRWISSSRRLYIASIFFSPFYLSAIDYSRPHQVLCQDMISGRSFAALHVHDALCDVTAARDARDARDAVGSNCDTVIFSDDTRNMPLFSVDHWYCADAIKR